MSADVRITVDQQAADDEEHESMSLALRRELLATEVKDVRFVRAGPAPEGTRGLDVTEVNQLLVTVPASLTALTALVTTVRSWLNRSGSGRTVEVTLGDKSLKLDSASIGEQQRLVEAFLQSAQPDVEGHAGS